MGGDGICLVGVWNLFFKFGVSDLLVMLMPTYFIYYWYWEECACLENGMN